MSRTEFIQLYVLNALKNPNINPLNSKLIIQEARKAADELYY